MLHSLSRSEAQALISACSRRAPTGIRNRALIATLYRVGLRLSEALELTPRDIDLETGEGQTRARAGQKSRPFGLDAGAIELIRRWKVARAQLAKPRGFDALNAPLFCTLNGGQLSPRYVQAALKRLGEKAGIEKHVHPRVLRQAFASELAKEGIPTDEIQAALGHENIETTERYISRLTGPSIRRIVAGRDSWGFDQDLDDEALLLINLLAKRGISPEKLVEALSKAS